MLIDQEVLESNPKMDLCKTMSNPQILLRETKYPDEVIEIIITWIAPIPQRLLFNKKETSITYERELSIMMHYSVFTLAQLRQLLINTPSITLKHIYGLLVDQWASTIYPQFQDMKLRREQQHYPTM